MQQYKKFELVFQGEEPKGSWSEIDLKARFTLRGRGKGNRWILCGKGQIYHTLSAPAHRNGTAGGQKACFVNPDRKSAYPVRIGSTME